MRAVPQPGDVIPLATGDAVILEVRDRYGNVQVLASRSHSVHPFAVWQWDGGGLFGGRYFRTLDEAETHWQST